MTDAILLPDLVTVVDRLVGTPHSPDYTCWDFIQQVFTEARGLTFDPEIEKNRMWVREVWWQDDPQDLLSVVQPYDILVLHTRGPMADHIGVVVDALTFAHNRYGAGVCREPIQKWQSRCLQVVRVQERA